MDLVKDKYRKKIAGNAPVQKAPKSNECLYRESDRTENMAKLQRYSNYWYGLSDFRTRTERAWRYRRGKQWDDYVYDPDTGEYLQEKELIEAQGQIAFVVNMIAPLVKNLKGQFRSSKSRSTVIARAREDQTIGEMLTNTLRYIGDVNKGWEKDANAMEIFLCSGACVQKVEYKYFPKKSKNLVRFKNCELANMFFNPVLDQELEDMTCIGEIHDMHIDKVVAAFAKNKRDEARIRQLYFNHDPNQNVIDETFTEDRIKNVNFYQPNDPNLCRVIESWEKVGEWVYWYHDWRTGNYDTAKMTEQNRLKFESINQKRINEAAAYGIPPEDAETIEYSAKFEQVWKYKFMTPYGETLAEGDTPYAHKEHPYVLLLYPMIRGEIWGFVEDVIDIQRGFNRDKILLDFVIGSSAKGLLVIDENSITDDFNFDEIAENWSKRNGIIKLNLKKGLSQMPQQIAGKAMPTGLNESLSLGMELMNKMGGVSDAIQGRNPGAGVPASRYAQEAQNSTINSKDYMDAFNAFRMDRDKKILDVMVQFTNEKLYLAISGNNYAEESKVFDPDRLPDDMDTEITMGMGADSQVYRAIMDDRLHEYVMKGLIPLKLSLKNSSLPFADQLLNDLEQMEQGMAQNGVPAAGGQSVPQQVVQGLQGQADATQANPMAVDMMKKYMGIN